MSGRGYLVDFCPRCRARMPRAAPEQHAVLQGALEDLSLQVHWPPGSGTLRGVSTWWQLVAAAFDRAQQEECELLPALDGKGFDGHGLDFVRGERRRRQLNNREISEIIEFVYSEGAKRGVKFRDFSGKKKAA